MVKKNKYPEIKPEFSKDKKKVYLDIEMYESIFEEMKDLKKQIKELNQKPAKKLNT